jgi:hypothetical protein
VEAAIDKLMLSFFGNIIQNGSSIEFQITERQVMSTQNINAFATRIRNILEKYNLPTIITLMESVPPKEVWKRAAIVLVSECHFLRISMFLSRKDF